jgi:hypothetical protein
MSDEKNMQPDVENEHQELSEEELNDVAGGSFSWGATQNMVSSYNQPTLNTFTPPSISSSLIDGIKGESLDPKL